jgi:folate receptor
MNCLSLLLVGLTPTLWFVNGEATLSPDQCRPFQSIYRDGKDLCERIFGDAFKYVPVASPEYNQSYTMWFFTDANPNDDTTKYRISLGKHDVNYQKTDVCYLQSANVTSHKPKPFAEGETFTECYPFRKNACCYEKTVEDADTINKLYGDEYRWDRCGPMRPECARFFVQESCFYECDPNAGLFRKYTPKNVSDDPTLIGSEWELYKLPLKGDYCDAWFQACRFESFCGNGDFFECSKIYSAPPPPSSTLSAGAIAGIVIGSICLVASVFCIAILIRNERRGRPMFQKINADDSQPLTKDAVQADSAGPQHANSGDIVTI